MPFLGGGSRFVLKKTFFWGFAGHPHVEAFQHTVELWICITKSPVFGIDFLFKFYNVDSVLGHILKFWLIETVKSKLVDLRAIN